MRKFFLIALFILFLISFFISYYDLISVHKAPLFLKQSNNDAANYSTTHTQFQNELVLVYIGCSTCPGANVNFLPDLIKELKQTLGNKAENLGYKFITIGISKDYNLKDGLNHLAKFGEFDEISTGHNWANLGIQKYIWKEIPGEPATPQIVLTKRTYGIINETGYIDYKALKEKEIIRKIGSAKILAWMENKVPTPGLKSLIARSSVNSQRN